MLAVGMAVWVLRYALFAVGAPAQTSSLIVLGVVVHGICYDFFFVTGQIYTDKKAPEPIRAQAQGLLVMLTLGVGMFIGAKVAGYIETASTPETFAAIERTADMSDAEFDTAKKIGELKQIDWQKLWGIPAIFAAAVLAFFFVAFNDDSADGEASSEDADADSPYERYTETEAEGGDAECYEEL